MTGRIGWRRGARVAAAVVVAFGLAAAGGGLAQAAGQGGARPAVPWRSVGPGWVLTEYWPGQFA
jgi:hypothetical protein